MDIGKNDNSNFTLNMELEEKNNMTKGEIKIEEKTAYQKTEEILYNYHDFKFAVKSKEQQIKALKANVFETLHSDIPDDFSVNMNNDIDKIKKKIKSLECSILITDKYLIMIEDALNSLKDDKYYGLIQMAYFENSNREEIAKKFNVDVSTISRNKTRLVNKLKTILFSDEVICDFYM